MSDPTNPPPGSGAPQPPTTPSNAPQKQPSGIHAMRRGGARREVTERVSMKTEDGRSFEGWVLNVSRGGLRAIVEDKVILGQRFEIEVGADETIRRQGRIVWVQEEPDGAIVGIEFTGASANLASVPPPPPGSQRIPSFAPATTPDEDEDK